MNGDSKHGTTPPSIQDIAERFVGARRSGRALEGFPGPLPSSLEDAYQCQDAAIELWPDAIGGWKVGRIPPAVEERFQCDRLAGPIFKAGMHLDPSEDCPAMPVFAGGFAAVEAEFVAVIGADAPPDKTDWSLDEAAAMIGDLHIGLEVASSPLATINEIGPVAVVSDFGNNAGLIVGPPIRDWRHRALDSLTCEAFVDERRVGRGGAFTLSGGFVRSVQFMLELGARRGRPLQAGLYIATGQTTGIHDVVIGQQARLDFGDDGALRCRFRTASG